MANIVAEPVLGFKQRRIRKMAVRRVLPAKLDQLLPCHLSRHGKAAAPSTAARQGCHASPNGTAMLDAGFSAVLHFSWL